ncbi:hypothetical protein [Paraburkholderia unamae]|uniref:Uncharacterized protein n=1 Tax=Paraburkholderia unamae TaxID=219649 RepID=A0ABX5KRL0_9BURK|nr:hypothetical protein [Paraburkholderia unamae]PVX85514.1 hypothetical protein C7402_10382 [Paraburkholderia unamae]RAR55274.1 hypothetical protein C7401_12258 [Paraburkholderia unamae]CAG9267964.1 conserved hypothetical protein [Paraburkholderia unamae]
MSYDFAEQDLVHIRSVVSHFEHAVDRARDIEPGSVASLNYWRARVTTILATPTLPMHVEKQARDVLGLLDRLDDACRCDRSGDARAPF